MRTRITLESTLTVPHWPLLVTSRYETGLDVVRVPRARLLALPSGTDIATILFFFFFFALVFIPADALVALEDPGTALTGIS